MAPAWYKSRSYRARTIREPRTVLAEFGLNIPVEVKPLLSVTMLIIGSVRSSRSHDVRVSVTNLS